MSDARAAFETQMVAVLLAIAIGEDDDHVARAAQVVAEYMSCELDHDTIDTCKARAIAMVEMVERTRIVH